LAAALKTRLKGLAYSCRHDGRGQPVTRRKVRVEVDGQCPACKRASKANRPSPPIEFLPRQPDPFRSPWAPPKGDEAT
jgi:hypothetical protein